jgi:riboflavin kinase/FMN adenylyltransferase
MGWHQDPAIRDAVFISRGTGNRLALDSFAPPMHHNAMAVHLFDWNKPLPDVCRGGALTIGNFDGVHVGHQALLAELVVQARALGGPAVALTFDPHPSRLLRPEQAQPLLTTTADRAELLQEHGARQVVIVPTTPGLLQLRAQEFFDQVLRARLAARTLVPGFNFAFGHNREGTVELLREMCARAGLGFVLVKPLESGGQPVSSSRVRGLLLGGNVREAMALLGRPYRLRGIVGAGQKRGKDLGFPTANLEQVPTLVPGDGVYAVHVHLGQRSWSGAANVGPNPTFGENTRKIEVHVIEYHGDLYGESLVIDFIERVRDGRAFAGPAELIEQLRLDVEQARRLCGRVEKNGPSQA